MAGQYRVAVEPHRPRPGQGRRTSSARAMTFQHKLQPLPNTSQRTPHQPQPHRQFLSHPQTQRTTILRMLMKLFHQMTIFLISPIGWTPLFLDLFSIQILTVNSQHSTLLVIGTALSLDSLLRPTFHVHFGPSGHMCTTMCSSIGREQSPIRISNLWTGPEMIFSSSHNSCSVKAVVVGNADKPDQVLLPILT